MPVAFPKETGSVLPRSQTSLSLCAQRTAGRRKEERRLADLVFKMAECSKADDYAIFKKEFRLVHFAYLEQKIACPHSVCQEEAVFFLFFFFKKKGLQQHYRIRHAEARFVPKIEEAAHVRMKKIYGREARNILEKLFENRSRQVIF